jgi:very-short-patch-repair endonuclease
MFRSGEVLVAIVNNHQDFAIAQTQHWYRIPVSSVKKFLRKRWPPEWLAFYQTKVFGQEAFAIRYYAKVIDIQEVGRADLFPNEPPHEKSHKRYYKLALSPLATLPQPIASYRRRRITFISTTWNKLISAKEINDLYDDSPLEDRLWQEMKTLQIDAERQERVKVKERVYFLDFAVYCAQGKINIETDGDRWHAQQVRIPEDNRRDNDLETLGWRTLRFNTKHVQEAMGEYCIPTIVENINHLGGLGHKGRRFSLRLDYPTQDGFSFRLLETEVEGK